MVTRAAHIAASYFSHAAHHQISALGNGLINDTFLVTAAQESFVLQRINTQVFPDPAGMMENLIRLNQHLRQKSSSEVRLMIPQLIKTLNHHNYAVDPQKNVWRALEFIDNTVSKELISNLEEAKQLGFALAHFHCLFRNVALDSFHDTLAGFHVTPEYLKYYQSLEDKQGNPVDAKKVQRCRQFIDSLQAQASVLETARLKGLLTESITHGDPKLNNFLFKKDSNQVLSLIDLDTVKPGLILHDIADCLRSCCHIKESNSFDIERCNAILSNYLPEMHGFLNTWDYAYLYPAIQLMPFELGLRFFSDYLAGNLYFKVNSPEQNLHRALHQFQLCESITQQEGAIRQQIEIFRTAHR